MLACDKTYHIYNRANGSEPLFYSDENYRYFLSRFKEFITPIAHTFCYCLMPNHFHFLIRIKSEKEVRAVWLEDSLNLEGFKNLEGLEERFVTQRFSNFFNAYSKALNKQQSRKGSVFMKTFKQKEVGDMSHLKKIVHYIHHNPIEAGICKTCSAYLYSSYNAIVGNSNSLICKNEVIEWFGDVENFAFIHSLPTDFAFE